MDSISSDLGFQAAREHAARAANAEDAALWRWFCDCFEEGRVRWCKSAQGWFVSVDHQHLSTESTFYDAIRIARERSIAGKRRVRGRTGGFSGAQVPSVEQGRTQ